MHSTLPGISMIPSIAMIHAFYLPLRDAKSKQSFLNDIGWLGNW
jgi:hypothetical protein